MCIKISNPYSFTAPELLVIKNNFTVHTDWEKDCFQEIKDNIRDHLRPEQGNKCCYCKRELGYDIKDVDIEHIIPKSKYPKFTFEPKNLALSCPGCNTIKGDDEVLKKKIVFYPKHSKNTLIIHAHYDEYDKHIEIHEGLLFEAITKKGSHTITTCELFRLKKALKKAKEQKQNANKSSQLVAAAMKADADELVEILKVIQGRIK